MFVVQIFLWDKWSTKLKAQLFVYSIHFVCLIIVGYHKTWKYFNIKIFHMKIFHMNFSQITD